LSNEYKPGFKAWLFSVIIAAGFGSLLADGIRYAVVEWRKSEATLELRDYHCKNEKERFLCNYYFENTGDELAYITDVIVDGEDHPIFFTNNPIEVFSEDRNEPTKRAHVAIAEPHKMLLISIAITKKKEEPEEVCFYNGDKELFCKIKLTTSGQKPRGI
jgi:hypothetical protein